MKLKQEGNHAACGLRRSLEPEQSSEDLDQVSIEHQSRQLSERIHFVQIRALFRKATAKTQLVAAGCQIAIRARCTPFLSA